MRKVGVIFVAVWLALAVSSHTARAGGNPTARTAKATYTMPAVGAAGFGGCATYGGQPPEGCIELPSRGGETAVKLSITDASGQPVYASWGQDLDGDQTGMTEVGGNFCGKTKGFVSIHPRVPVVVYIWEGPGFDPPCSGLATSGTIKGTFLKSG